MPECTGRTERNRRCSAGRLRIYAGGAAAAAVAAVGGAREEARVVGERLAPLFYIKIQTAASLLRIRQLSSLSLH